MNFFKIVFTLVIISILTISCKKEGNINNSKKKIQKDNLIVNYKKSEFQIKGMTCEIGCAKLIQSKLSKVDGIKFVKVSFKDSLGMVEYDSNKLTNKKIKTIVENIAGGDLYTLTKNKEVLEFQTLKK